MITYARVLLKLALVALSLAVITNPQSGGQFKIESSVIASGGGTSSGGQFTVEGTSGQPAAGTRMGGSPFTQTAGFWQPVPFAPTAANVSISGRILSARRRGISGVRITLIAPNGTIRTATSGTFGFYEFQDVPTGKTYTLTVTSRRFAFENQTQIVSVTDAVSGVDFFASARGTRD